MAKNISPTRKTARLRKPLIKVQTSHFQSQRSQAPTARKTIPNIIFNMVPIVYAITFSAFSAIILSLPFLSGV